MRLKPVFAAAVTMGALAIELPAAEIISVGLEQADAVTGALPEKGATTIALGSGIALAGIGFLLGGARLCGVRFKR